MCVILSNFQLVESQYGYDDYMEKHENFIQSNEYFEESYPNNTNIIASML